MLVVKSGNTFYNDLIYLRFIIKLCLYNSHREYRYFATYGETFASLLVKYCTFNILHAHFFSCYFSYFHFK